MRWRNQPGKVRWRRKKENHSDRGNSMCRGPGAGREAGGTKELEECSRKWRSERRTGAGRPTAVLGMWVFILRSDGSYQRM